MEPVLSVVLPTFNEAGNVPVLVQRLEGALRAVPHEIIVADDDSPDRTWEVAEALRERFPSVRCLRRTQDKGLYPSVIEAFRLSRGAALAVMDADLQHDEGVLPAMLDRLRKDGLALVVASRYGAGGGIEGWSRPRRILSRLSTLLTLAALGRTVTDPLSGFFMIDRKVFLELAPRLTPKGFKILMDILGNLPPGAAVGEVGYVFKPRREGKSKLGLRVTFDSLASLGALALKRCRRRPS